MPQTFSDWHVVGVSLNSTEPRRRARADGSRWDLLLVERTEQVPDVVQLPGLLGWEVQVSNCSRAQVESRGSTSRCPTRLGRLDRLGAMTTRHRCGVLDLSVEVV